METPETIMIDSQKYIREDSIPVKRDPSRTKIVILQRGWVAVGEYSEKGDKAFLKNAQIIRRWGTTKGLGELAERGPLTNTNLDPSGDLSFNVLTVVATMDINEDNWK